MRPNLEHCTLFTMTNLQLCDRLVSFPLDDCLNFLLTSTHGCCTVTSLCTQFACVKVKTLQTAHKTSAKCSPVTIGDSVTDISRSVAVKFLSQYRTTTAMCSRCARSVVSSIITEKKSASRTLFPITSRTSHPIASIRWF